MRKLEEEHYKICGHPKTTDSCAINRRPLTIFLKDNVSTEGPVDVLFGF